MPRHPTQPVERDTEGTFRFKVNAIVRHLLDNNGPHDMNSIGVGNFSREDRVQFAQLIGYSVYGFGDLSYIDNEDYDAAIEALEACQEVPAAPVVVEDALSPTRFERILDDAG
jgi:hypothetical protein